MFGLRTRRKIQERDPHIKSRDIFNRFKVKIQKHEISLLEVCSLNVYYYYYVLVCLLYKFLGAWNFCSTCLVGIFEERFRNGTNP